ncbi:MAG: outer membrane protein assembly factor BamA [Elusimicrobiota bacterium]|nr:outer membrane protein assembly factor BamA [Elusimicrobiota bacterium]
MKKLNLLISIFYFLVSFVQAEFVKEIIIKGNINIKEKVIRDKIKTKVKDIYSPENLRQDLNSILELGYFEDVTVEVDTPTYKVIFTVREKPKLKKIDFKGNKKFSKGQLKDEIKNKEKEYLDRAELQNDIKKIVELYSEKGYADTEVDYDIYVDKITNSATLTFFITEGRKVTVEDISITGTKYYRAKKILRQLQTKKKKIFKEKILNEDIEKVTEFYKKNGFESFTISTPTLLYNEDRTKVSIKLNIDEGPRYKIGKISFSGNTVYSDKELYKAIVLKPKMLYNKEKIDLALAAISELYADKGYLRAEIKPEFMKYVESGIMDIKFDITENNLIYLDRIYIDGLTHTKEFVIAREAQLKEGEPFSTIKLRRSVERIYNLGFIDEVKVDLQDTGNPDTADLVLTVTEGKPGMLSAGAGYSSVDKLVGTLQVSHMNLFGRAQRLSLLWEFGERKQNFEISWTEPYFMRKPVSLGASLFNLTRKQFYGGSEAYTSHRQGIELRVGPRLTEYLSLLFSYGYERVTIFDAKTDPTTGKKYAEERTDITSSLTNQISYDSRDNIFDPTRGCRNSLSLQITGGPFQGDVHFYKPVVRSSWFLLTFWKFVLSANATFGLIEAYQNYILPTQYKFFTGGPDTVRGYVYNEVSPATGGEVMFVGNVEYKFPIVQEKGRTILQGAIFYDLGAAWEKDKVNFTVGETCDWSKYGKFDNLMKSGFGFGIRFTTPVFPIRLDWGWPLQPRPGQTGPEFYFTIGQIF